MAAFRYVLAIVLLVALLFGSSGRVDLPFLWAYVALLALGLIGVGLAIDPELRRERMRAAPGGHDRRLRLQVLPFILAHFAVAGLDVGRFGWSGEVPLAVHLAGFAGVALGLGLIGWSMVVNRFFSPVMRIQAERGHHLVTAGPYRWVRHPGYAGIILLALSSGPALGSWWSMLPLAGYIALILRRAVREDRFLQKELPGYAEYAARVRARLVPGLW
jgi:protein-S-isoprenylcysteine O-methyltransferase Ste14